MQQESMFPFSPIEFVKRWPGSLHPITMPAASPSLPDRCTQLLTEFGLPRIVTISCYNDITLKFTGTLTPLSVAWNRDLQNGYKIGEFPKEWNCYWHIGDQEYLQGDGWICIEENTSRLVVIDLDQPDPIYLLNANLDNFYAVLAHLLDWSETSEGSFEDTEILRDQLRSQNNIPLDELEGFWMNFIDATLDRRDPITLAVQLRTKET